MKQFLLLTLMALSFSVSAQLNLEMSPNPISEEGLPTAPDIAAYFTVANLNTSDEAMFYWRIANSSDAPDEWEIHICDKNLCYFHTVHTCPDSNPNILDAGASHVFEYHVNPYGHQDEFTGVFELFSLDDPETVISSIDITVSTIISSSEDLISNQNFTVFPNPTAESFQIKNDEHVGTISIYNIIGKQIESHVHTTGKIYNVSDFRKGLYFVRLFDKDGQSLKSIRLNKE
jgi:hypothetical protein